jgi:type IV pilus assembly protein PilB
VGVVEEADLEALRDTRVPHAVDELVAEEKLNEDQVLGVVSAAYGFGCHSSRTEFEHEDALALLSERVCLKHRVVPVSVDAKEITIATAEPLNQDALEDVAIVSGRKVVPLFAVRRTVTELLDRIFDKDNLILDLVDRLGEASGIEVIEEALPSTDEEAAETDALSTGPVVTLVNAIIGKAVSQRASDIHIEHEAEESRVRFRIDGVMRDALKLPISVGNGPLVSRIKVMASLDLADRLRPQDGRIQVLHAGRAISLRVSVLPSLVGEAVVLRVLDAKAVRIDPEGLSLSEPVKRIFLGLSKKPQGLSLIAGPTGSGKSTTAYALLKASMSSESITVTVENPVEYQMPGVKQVQVNPKQGLSFSAALRSVLRQDPDQILVGEVRDAETADIALQAAISGHAVVSTIHTNDAVASIVRLAGMGIEKFKVAEGVNGVLSQRLVRRLCRECRKKTDWSECGVWWKRQAKRLGIGERWVAGGCEACGFTGFKGRVPVIEALTMTSALRDLLHAGSTIKEFREEAHRSGALRPLVEDALWHIGEGIICVEEVEKFVDIPLEEEAPARGSDSDSAEPGDSEGAEHRGKVLLVDDDPSVLETLHRWFSAAGFEPSLCSSANEALQRVREERPDFMLLDHRMPGMSGIEVLRGLRQGLGDLSLPVIMLTADDNPNTRKEAFTTGCTDYMLKPVDFSVLETRVKAALLRGAGRTS